LRRRGLRGVRRCFAQWHNLRGHVTTLPGDP
jgi:hypothetical protein